jgi:hypothetical protein
VSSPNSSTARSNNNNNSRPHSQHRPTTPITTQSTAIITSTAHALTTSYATQRSLQHLLTRFPGTNLGNNPG